MSLPYIEAAKLIEQALSIEEEAKLALRDAMRRHGLAAMAPHIKARVTWDGDINLDYDEIGRILREDMREPINELAAEIAAKVDVGSVTDAPVTVLSATTDRAIAIVAIAHPAGDAIQAKHGALTKAAAACGYEVKSQ